MCATCNGRSRCGGVVRAAELTAEHVGYRITWADKTRRHHITLGHVHVETGAGRDVVLIRAKDADPWDAWALDGKRKVQVHE